jgi:hypothetical protein
MESDVARLAPVKSAGLAALLLVGSASAGGAAPAPPAPSPASAVRIVTGTYWPENACVRFVDRADDAYWTWCVESVTVRPNGEVAFRCVWAMPSYMTGAVEKGPDENNPKMYIVDGNGHRYDHVATTEAAKSGGTLSSRTPTLRGDFVFRPGAGAAPPFTFHDDDNDKTLGPIALEPARRSDGPHPAGTAGVDVRVLLARIRHADRVEIVDEESGLGGGSSARNVLRREGGAATDGVAVPAALLDGFLARLADAPVVSGDYVPAFEHTDDYPHFAITIGSVGGGAVVFFSDSQGGDRVPWALEIEGARFIVPSDAPARALDLVRRYLTASPVPSRPGR